MRYRAVIVEDEELARIRLKRLLEGFRGEIEVVGEASDGISAVSLIGSARPDLLFLDIKLPGLSGFEVLKRLESQPAIVFTTAHDKHALEAFQTYAVDYLLKPIESESLARAVLKLKTLGFNQGRTWKELEDVLKGLGASYRRRFTLKVGEKLVPVSTSEIVYCRSDNKYTCFHTSSRKILDEMSLVDLEKELNPREFVRIHRSTIVNISWIAEIRKLGDGKLRVVMKDAAGTQLDASKLHSEKLRNL